jgi:hypothetical protein
MLSGHLFAGFLNGRGHGGISTGYFWSKVRAGIGRADMRQQNRAPLLALHRGKMQGHCVEISWQDNLAKFIIEIGN